MRLANDADSRAALDEAFSGNRLLSCFAAGARGYFEPAASIVELPAGKVLYAAGEELTACLFPLGAASISLIVDLSNGRAVEVASIGREGAIGGIISCG